MHRRIATLIALLLALSGTTFLTLASPAQAKDANCSDFSSQASAQNYFLNHGGPNSDPDGLDSDGDGIACESNPCPCSTNTGGGGGGGGHAPAPKKFHIIKVRGQETMANKFEAIGSIVTLKNGRFTIQRKAGGSGWQAWKYVKTQPNGKFRTKIKQAGQKKTCFRVVAPETKKYKKTIGKNFGCIVSS